MPVIDAFRPADHTGSDCTVPSNQPRITVYIASHNYGRFLAQAVESVLRQSTDDWELLIIDDNSTDETEDVMALYQGHPKIRLYRTEGIGLPGVCNMALRESRGRYLIRLDGDDIFDENILLILANHLNRHPATALVFPDYYLIDEVGEVFALERRPRLYVGDHLLDMPPNGACTMIRKSVLEEVGGYREDLGAQDGFDLWTKIRDRYRSFNVNLPLFYYRRHGQNLTGNDRRILLARRQIKMDNARERLDRVRPIIAVIPCRRHFDFQSDLWRAEINGQSLLERDLATCLASPLFDRVVVASDNPEAEETVRRFDDPRATFVLRSPEHTTRSSSIVPTLHEIVQRFDPALSGLSVLRYIQSPFVTTATLEEAVSTLVLTDADSACPVEEMRCQIYERSPHGLSPLNARNPVTMEFDPIYREPSTCTATRNQNVARGALLGAVIASFGVSSAECFFIGSATDLRVARLMAQELR